MTDRLSQCESVMVELSNGLPPDAKTIARLREDLGEELAQIVFTSAALQSKARSKLGDGVWWTSEKSLQQATPWQVAKLKATWFAARPVADLCSGIGGDAIALARRGPVVAIDRDETVSQMATANLGGVRTSYSAIVHCDDVCSVEISPDQAVHIDPDRRAGRRRTTDPDRYQPSWEDVTRIVRHTESAIVKLAPAARPDVSDWGATHRVWISLSGTVREQSLLWGDAIERSSLHGGEVSAYRIRHDASWSRFTAAETEVHDLPTNPSRLWRSDHRPSEYLIDPDASIRAAGLTVAFANQNRLMLLGKPSGFLTATQIDGSKFLGEGLAVVGRVIWSGAADDRKLRREFRSRGVYPQTIKVRGTDHDPAVLTRRYRDTGDHPVTLWIGRAGGRVYAAITDPVSGEESRSPDQAGELV